MSDKSLTDEDVVQLMETNPWWKDIADEANRYLRVQQLNDYLTDSGKVTAVNVILERASITEEQIEKAQSDPTFLEAKNIIQSLKAGDRFPGRLTELYQSKKPDALERFNHYALRLISLISDGSVRQEAERLWNQERSSFASIDLDNLPPLLRVRETDQRYILRCLIELSQKEILVRDHRHYPFSEEQYVPAKAGEKTAETESITIGKGDDRINYLAYRVYDPLWDQGMEHYEPEYVRFPLKWTGSTISVSALSRLYIAFKNGEDITSNFFAMYQEEGRLDRLRNAIASCPVTARHGEIFGEIVDSFRAGHYKICSTTLLSLIEGILWDYAWFWNNVHGGLFAPQPNHTQYEEGVGFELLREDGTRIGGRPNIGHLLKDTKFGREIYSEFIEYLVKELFSERNPVLHGREPDYGGVHKAATFLYVVETIERNITGDIKAEIIRKKVIEYVLESKTQAKDQVADASG